MARWKVSVHKNVPDIEWIHGNALHINPKKGESIVGFDRIYVGASVEKESVSKLTCLLRPGGILIGPGKQMHCDIVICVCSAWLGLAWLGSLLFA